MALRNVVLFVFGVGLLLCALLYAYFPAVPHSVLGWVALIGLGLPAWIFLEWLGETVVGSRFFARRSSGVRILLGVATALAILAIAWGCVRLVQVAVFVAG
jgi:hypothetical protein